MRNISFRCDHRLGDKFRLNVDFCSDRQVVALFGPSGSGKSTILSMIAGFVKPERGCIAVGDKLLFDSEKKICLPIERRQTGLVSQDHLLFPHMNVRGNLNYGLATQRNADDDPNENYFEKICDVLELRPLLNRYPINLSGGESQRVAIGRALVRRPRVLLLDEPLSALDAGLESKIISYLQSVIEALRIPVFFVSHRQSHVRRLADWVIVVEHGKKISEGVPEEALAHERPMGWTRSTAPVNLLKLDSISRDNGDWTGTVAGQRLFLPQRDFSDSNIYLQFAPSDITLTRASNSGLSARNRLSATVRQVLEINGAAFVALDIGQIIWAEVTLKSAAELGLATGEKIGCLIKSQSLDVI